MLPSALRRLLLASSVVLIAFPRVAAAEQTWREVHSPHFRVLTDGSEREGRNVAFMFEQMRHVFTGVLKREDIEGGAPLTIVAARDGVTWRELEPALAKSRGDTPLRVSSIVVGKSNSH